MARWRWGGKLSGAPRRAEGTPRKEEEQSGVTQSVFLAQRARLRAGNLRLTDPRPSPLRPSRGVASGKAPFLPALGLPSPEGRCPSLPREAGWSEAQAVPVSERAPPAVVR